MVHNKLYKMRRISFISLLLSAFMTYVGGYSTHQAADFHPSYQNREHEQMKRSYQGYKYKKYEQHENSASKITYIVIIAILIAIVASGFYYSYKQGTLPEFFGKIAFGTIANILTQIIMMRLIR